MVSAPVELQRAARASIHPARAFVWARASDDDAPVTYALSDQGDVVAMIPGVQIAAAKTVWTWDEAAVPAEVKPCDQGDEPAGEGRATRVTLVPSDSAHAPLAVVRPRATAGASELDHTARLVASVGPYLFVEETTYTYTCGVHGNTEVRFTVWNLEERVTLDLLAELPDRDRLALIGKGAIDEDPEAANFASDDDPPTLTELVPRLGPNGRLLASAVVTVPSCFACNGEGASSSTSSTSVPVDLPPSLRMLGPVPESVERFADAHPTLLIGGYSVAGGL
jgi:hypothetical protein